MLPVQSLLLSLLFGCSQSRAIDEQTTGEPEPAIESHTGEAARPQHEEGPGPSQAGEFAPVVSDQSPAGMDTATPQAPEVAVIPEPELGWLVMVYMSADSDLTKAADKDIREMLRVGSNEGVQVVVFLDPRGKPAERFQVGKGRRLQVGSHGEVDMSQPSTLFEFVRTATRDFPAKRKALVLWGHGVGAASGKQKVATRPADTWKTSLDSSGSVMSATSVAEGLEGVEVDLLGFDACLMQAAEVGYELRSRFTIMVGSRDTLDTSGWAYDKIFRQLTAQTTAEDLAKYIVSSATDHNRELTSGFQRRAYESAAVGLASIADQILSSPDSDEEAQALLFAVARAYVAVNRSRTSAGDRAADLLHFLKTVRSSAGSVRFPKAAARFLDDVEVQGIFAGKASDASYSMSIFLPWIWNMNGSLEVEYAGLDFASATRWNHVLSRVTPLVFDYILDEADAAFSTDIGKEALRKTIFAMVEVVLHEVRMGETEKVRRLIERRTAPGVCEIRRHLWEQVRIERSYGEAWTQTQKLLLSDLQGSVAACRVPSKGGSFIDQGSEFVPLDERRPKDRQRLEEYRQRQQQQQQQQEQQRQSFWQQQQQQQQQ